MNDFLHNLRNGNTKRFDRNRKQYDAPPYRSNDRFGNQRDKKNQNYSQRKPSDTDQLTTINKLLESIVENQKRQAEQGERIASAEERKATALESIMVYFKSISPASGTPAEMPLSDEPTAAVSAPETADVNDDMNASESTVEADLVSGELSTLEAAVVDDDMNASGSTVEADLVSDESSASVEMEATPGENPQKVSSKITKIEKDEALRIIFHMRADGVSYEKIANHLDAIDMPTLSGKGQWRGHTVYRLFKSVPAGD
jgi:hypothetical protein